MRWRYRDCTSYQLRKLNTTSSTFSSALQWFTCNGCKHIRPSDSCNTNRAKAFYPTPNLPINWPLLSHWGLCPGTSNYCVSKRIYGCASFVYYCLCSSICSKAVVIICQVSAHQTMSFYTKVNQLFLLTWGPAAYCHAVPNMLTLVLRSHLHWRPSAFLSLWKNTRIKPCSSRTLAFAP